MENIYIIFNELYMEGDPFKWEKTSVIHIILESKLEMCK